MLIAWIGGLERSGPHLAAVAEEEGHRLELHSGVVHGRGAAEIEALVLRADLVLLVTGVNSHMGVLHAKRACRRHGRELVIVRSLGPTRLRSLIRGLGSDAGRRPAAA